MVDWKSQNLAYKIVDNVCRMVGLTIVLLLHCCTGKLSCFRLLETMQIKRQQGRTSNTAVFCGIVL